MSFFNMKAPASGASATPSVKRQKTPEGYAPTSLGYDSNNDSGDDLLNDYIPDTPRAFETQPTQIIDRAAPLQSNLSPIPAGSVIQVPASSPFSGRDAGSPLQPKPKSGPNQYSSPHFAPKPSTSSVAKTLGPAGTYKPAQSNIAKSMAPAGTAYKAPNGVVSKPAQEVIVLDDDDELPEPEVMKSRELFGDSESDDDDESASRATIKPSTFTSAGSAHNSFGSPASFNTKFQSIIANSAYTPGDTKQTRPDRAKSIEDISLEDMTDQKLRDGVIQIRNIFPTISIHAARDALIACKGSFENAIQTIERANSSQSNSQSRKPIVIDDDDDDETESTSQPQMKRVLSGPTTSLRDKYSSTQALTPRQPDVAPQRQKRKLVKGRRNASSPAPIQSPVKAPKQASPEIQLEDFDTDSGLASESEDDPEIEAQCLKFFNTSSLKDLIELTNTNLEYAEVAIAGRPYKNLDRVRELENPKLTKTGKKSKRAPIGEGLVKTAMEMLSGYQAVDSLVAACGDIAKPIRAEMATWGIKIHGHGLADGELEMTSFDEGHDDSGLGTPSGGTPTPLGDDDVKVLSTRTRFNYLKKPDLMAEDCVLKDYQVVGLNWLAMMYRQKVSCILADEMGLGKTCQVIAFLSHLVETGHSGPHLVICPGSTLENWLRELNRFAPELSIEPYHGAQKDRAEMADLILENRSEINVVVTTYDMAVKPADNQFLRKLRADVCVYDEGHMLKNPKSQRYGQLVKIPSNLRLLLTGTPLQNNLQELAALLAFIMPAVFKELEDDLNFVFKSKATTKDADHAALLSAQRIERAKSMLTPFVLRRKKTQVLKHLPAKTCRVHYTKLHPAQKKIYDGHLEQARERARAKVEGTKLGKDKNDENNPLMQLRKAAIHPLLFRRHFTDEKIEKMADILRRKVPVEFSPDAKREHLINEMKSFNDYNLHLWCRTYPCIESFDIPDLAWMNSGKVAALVELVQEYKKNGDRVLVFSQFALVMDILEAVLNTEQVRYIRLDGNTKIDERQTLIDAFRDEEEITAFLLTTKAGGTGINLMYANKVIIFDGSFNPQDDRQAENRAHRVGQTREVEVVRLVTRSTIEEQIYALGQSKLMLDGRVAGEKDGDENAVGEKAVAEMLLNGTGFAAEGSCSESEATSAKPPSSSPRKQSTLLGMATQSPHTEAVAGSKKRKSRDDDEGSTVKKKRAF